MENSVRVAALENCREDDRSVEVTVVGYGNLYRWLSAGEKGETFTLAPGTTLAELVVRSGIPEEEIWLITVNGKKAAPEQVLHPGDQIRLFSPLGGGA